MNSLERFEVNKCRVSLNYPRRPIRSLQLCEKAYAEPKRLYRHMFDTHGVSREEIDLIKSRKRNDKVENVSRPLPPPIIPPYFSCLPQRTSQSFLVKSAGDLISPNWD